jgi:thioredoxin-like negative regulator of GroEL
MKKQRQKPNTRTKRADSVPADQPTSPDRRNFMRLAKNAAIGVPIVSVGCYFAIKKVQGDLYEADLSRIGNGTPTVVQIHDPQCPLCLTLQRQTRSALARYDDAGYTYLVANITTDSGYAFANQYGVSHVTLLLFDAAGKMVEAVRGPIETAPLESILARHING